METTKIKQKGKEAVKLLNQLVEELPEEDEVCIRCYIKKDVYNSTWFQEFLQQIEELGIKVKE